MYVFIKEISGDTYDIDITPNMKWIDVMYMASKGEYDISTFDLTYDGETMNSIEQLFDGIELMLLPNKQILAMKELESRGVSKDSMTGIVDAVKIMDYVTVQLFIERGFDFSNKRHLVSVIMSTAAMYCDMSFMEFLLESGFQLYGNYTSVINVCINRHRDEMIMFLLKQNLKILPDRVIQYSIATDNIDMFKLVATCKKQQVLIDCVAHNRKLFVEYIFSQNLMDKDDINKMMRFACNHDSIDVFFYLVSIGGDVRARNSIGETCESYVKSVSILTYMLDNGCNFMHPDAFMVYPIKDLASRCDASLVIAYCNKMGKKGIYTPIYTPLQVIALLGRSDVVDELINYGLDINERSFDGIHIMSMDIPVNDAILYARHGADLSLYLNQVICDDKKLDYLQFIEIINMGYDVHRIADNGMTLIDYLKKHGKNRFLSHVGM